MADIRESPALRDGLDGFLTMAEFMGDTAETMPQGEIGKRNTHVLLEQLVKTVTAQATGFCGLATGDVMARLKNELNR